MLSGEISPKNNYYYYHSTKQTPITMVIQSGIHFAAESTETMRIECLAQRHNILMQPGFEPSIAVSKTDILHLPQKKKFFF